MDFQPIIDALTQLEQASDGLIAADKLKANNDAKFEAAKLAKDSSDKADVDAAGTVNAALDSFGSLVAQFVSASKVTRGF